MKKEIFDSKNNLFYHSLTPNEVINKLESQKEGLSVEEVKSRLEKNGLNIILEKKTSHPLLIFLKQFNSFFVYILIIAVIISFSLKNLIDAYVIIVVIMLNSSIGFFQEYKAEKAIRALKQMIVPYAKVYRDSELLQIPAKELVQGDIILLEEGDRIPADARLIETRNFSTIEASLTGESLPAEKHNRQLNKNISLADQRNMIWMGTFVSSGTAKAVVTTTGMKTVIGTIAKDIEKIKEEKSHFQKKTDDLAIKMGAIAITSSAIIFLVGFFIRGFDFPSILIFTLASLVAGIPEGLPAILAIVLAIGAFRMAKRKAIIRKLSAVETLAIVNTIITDKTGTLTQNTMTVRKILLPNEDEISVSGNGFIPKGEFFQNKKQIIPLEIYPLDKLLHISAICNNSKLIKEINREEYKIIGDPTEASLLALAEKSGLKPELIEQKERRLDDFPFSQDLKCRASLISSIKEKKKQIYVIGAPEVILKNSSHVLKLKTQKKLTQLEKIEIIRQINYLTTKAMRVLAFAYKDVSDNTVNLEESQISSLTYVGIVGIIDPPKPEVKEAIARAKKAGIRVIMATGDHKNTALAIAKEIGLISSSEKVLAEEELKSMTEHEFNKAIKEVNVFARLTPHMKLRIAEALQNEGNIVAMTGDGVNDAPALKKADIGISMGIIGTDVARESSEIILADDNFASIINAVEEGNIVFTNTKQTSFFLIVTNFAEALTIISSLVINLPLPLLPTQILWLNLVTDTGPALGLAVEPAHDNLEEQKPKNPKENILTRELLPFLLVTSITMVILTILSFKFFISYSIEKARTAAFVIMSLTQLFNSLNMRSLKKSLFKIKLFSNFYMTTFLVLSFLLLLILIYLPLAQSIFQFTTLTLMEFFILLILSSSVLWFGEIYKRFRNNH